MQKKLHKEVTVIIPNKNGKGLLGKHLPAVIEASCGAEIIVVDDASDDGSVQYLKSEFPGVKIVEKKTSSGFAGTVNTGVNNASGEILILLNTDVEPEPGFLTPLIRHFRDENVFAVGCLDKSHEADGIALRGRGEASWIKGFYVHRRGEVDRTDTAWVSGGSGAFRKTCWEKLGGMDELYSPFYWEDIDISYRARKAGYRILFEPESVVHHYHEAGAIKHSYTPGYVRLIASRNQFIFIWKNLTDKRIWLLHLMYLPVRLFRDLVSGDGVMFRGAVMALQYLPRIIGQRKIRKPIQKVTDRDL